MHISLKLRLIKLCVYIADEILGASNRKLRFVTKIFLENDANEDSFLTKSRTHDTF